MSRGSRSYDVVIVGGGVVGLTAAWMLRSRLGKQGRIAVLDQSEPGREASWAGAGILSPGDPFTASPALRELARQSAASWPDVSQKLADETGVQNGYVQCGGIEICDSTADVRRDLECWKSIGVQALPLTETNADLFVPQIRADRQLAYFLPELAQVRNPRHLKALQAALAETDDLLPGMAVHDWVRDRERIAAVRTPQGLIEANQFLLAAGAWSGSLLAGIAPDVEIEPVRGQIALLRLPHNQIVRVLQHGKRYIVPRHDGRVLVGATEEWAGFEKRNTAAEVQGLLDFAGQLVPALASATVEKLWSGLRPHATRGKPYVGLVPGTPNLYVAAGHFRSGLFLSPATGRLVSQLMLGESPCLGPELCDELAPT